MVALADCNDNSKSALVNLREEYIRDMKTLTDTDIQFIINKQFEMVGATAPPFKELPREWYLQNRWSPSTEALFRDWLSEHFKDKLKISKRKAEYEALSWIFNYGFTTVPKPSVTETD